MILTSVILSQYSCITDNRQTDDRQHIMTIAGHRNEIFQQSAKMGEVGSETNIQWLGVLSG